MRNVTPPTTSTRPTATAEIIDFDAALLDACSPQARADLLSEAALLAKAFAADGDMAQLERLVDTLVSGARELEIDRGHARRLAAAIRRLAAA